jgi:two-component system sensor histidine kinase/response regulator
MHEQRWRDLTEALPQLVWSAMPDGSCDYFSAQWTEHTGVPEPDLLGWRWLETLHPDDREPTRKFWLESVAEHHPYDIEYRVRRRDGEYRWFKTRGMPVRDSNGTIIKWFGTGTDITELRETQEALRDSERRFRVFVDHAADAFYLTDEKGRILDVNGRACEALGYTRDEVIGMTPSDFVSDLNFTVVEDRVRRLLAGETIRFEDEYRRKDGTVFPVEVRSKAFWEGDRAFIVHLPRDVTDRKQAEEKLRESEQRWRSLTEALPQLVWSATSDGTCDYFSSQWTEHTGVAEAELLGWRWLETLHPDDREPTRRFWLESVAGHHAYDIEYRVRHKGGEYRWFKTRGVPIRDTGGNIVKWFGTCTDITELRDSEERFRGTFENAAVGIGHLHPTSRLLRVNEKGCAILGYSREELLGQNLLDFSHPDDLAITTELLAGLLRGDSLGYTVEKRYRRKDGSFVWCQVAVSLQRDAAGEPAYAIGIIQDISERKQLEGELRQAKDAAEAANRAKDEFLANVSHEIRTPMNAIIGMTELVLDTTLDEGQRQSLKTVKSAADSLLGIINDLLDFSKIEAGKLELAPTDFSLRRAVADTLRALAVRAHKKGLELIYQVQPDVPDALIGDVGRLRQVLLNLAGNAVKFTDGGEVEVRVEVADSEVRDQKAEVRSQKSEVRNQRTDVRAETTALLTSDLCPLTSDTVGLRFTVRDTGIGIPAEQQERIFRAFEQEDTSTTRKYGGTGLGLTIAARLVDLMGGTITVDSSPGRGSTFVFTARFGRQAHATQSESTPLPDSPGARLKSLPVLVVDDNGTNRQILEEWLRNWQMNPTAVGDGMAAMDALWHRAANDGPYPLVLLDARMPDADGLTVAGMIRERAELAATRIILLTSGERPGDAARFRELRIDAQLVKPVQQDELLETIYRVMSRDRVSGRVVSGEYSARRSQQSVPLTTHDSPLTAPLHILVAEDNELSAQVLEQSLVRQGHRVRVESNGREVLALAEQGGFDLVLLDVHMPELDGFQVVRAVRERELTAGGHLPIIALTARSRKEDRERCLAAGMDDFQTKPIRPVDLLAAIDRVLRANSSRHSRKRDLVDATVLLAACGGDPPLLRRMCQTLSARVPEHLAALRDALRGQDAPRLREAAHKCCGMLSEFSSVAGDLSGSLEELAAGAHLEKAGPVLEQLETTAQELVKQIDGITVEALRHQVGHSDEHSGTARP